MLLAMSCGILTWRTVYSSDSPDHRAQIAVQDRCGIPDCAVQVVAQRGWHTANIATKSDCVVFFAQAVWSGTVVAVFVDGTYCGTIKAAFDVATDRKVEFEAFAPQLQSAIIREYGVTADELRANGGDVFKWATYPGRCCSRGSDEFRKRHGLYH
jgi:hypothetical protein